MPHVTLTMAQLKTLSTFTGVTVTVLYGLDAAGKVSRVAFFNNNGVMQTFLLHPKPNVADFISALQFPTAIQVETIE